MTSSYPSWQFQNMISVLSKEKEKKLQFDPKAKSGKRKYKPDYDKGNSFSHVILDKFFDRFYPKP